jgi:hypothetical protein
MGDRLDVYEGRRRVLELVREVEFEDVPSSELMDGCLP